jgi:DNA polymerase-3 subunit epsilon
MREVLLDTETTGLETALGHRIIEICCIELRNHMPTGRHFHEFVDPGREIDPDAGRVHGISRASLIGKPAFADIADPLLAFLGDDPIVAHNAPFDFGFIDAEFARLSLAPLDRARMVDTVAMARRKYPGLPASLDALCRRFDIDLSQRTTHNALLDCRLLAQVYVELLGGRQPGLGLVSTAASRAAARAGSLAMPVERTQRPVRVTEEERAAHAAFLDRFVKEPVWSMLGEASEPSASSGDRPSSGERAE